MHSFESQLRVTFRPNQGLSSRPSISLVLLQKLTFCTLRPRVQGRCVRSGQRGSKAMTNKPNVVWRASISARPLFGVPAVAAQFCASILSVSSLFGFGAGQWGYVR
jgi:hypothetical protein